MQRRIYEILTQPRPGDRIGSTISISLLALIAANVTAGILATDPTLAATAGSYFRTFEVVSVAIFTSEYVLRVWSCPVDPRFAGPYGRLRMALSPMAIIDVLAIAPFYFDLAFPGFIDLRFLRVIRLLRLFRLFRAPHLAEAVSTLGRVVAAKRSELAVTFVIVLMATLLSAGVMFVIEQSQPETQFTSIPRAMWWAICTVTTIGYGDLVPASAPGRLLASFVALIGICAVALPVGIFSSGFVEELGRKRNAAERASERCPHCGGSIEPAHRDDVAG